MISKCLFENIFFETINIRSHTLIVLLGDANIILKSTIISLQVKQMYSIYGEYVLT